MKKLAEYGDRTKLEGFDISSRFFEFLDHNTIVVNHEYKGVFLIELDENYEKATQIKLMTQVVKVVILA